MSDFLIDEKQWQNFAGLIYSKLKPGGLYSITHFSERESCATGCHKARLDELKILFPDNKWEQIKPWYRSSWGNKEKDGHEYYAYKAVLSKKPESVKWNNFSNNINMTQKPELVFEVPNLGLDFLKNNI